MRKTAALAMGLVLFASPVALAQGSGATSSSKSISSRPGAGSAPVGHRQPTAADVGKEPGAPFEKSAEDRELDRKIKNICKGC